MRVACELCSEVAEATLRAGGDGVVAITCAACGGTFAAPLAPATAPPAPATAPPAPATAPPTTTHGPVCPKCEAPATGDGPCPRCGLAPGHAEAWRRRHAEAPTATIGAAWEAVEAAWSDEAAHERAASIAIAGGELAWLAARYRGVLRDRPDDDAARRQLDRLSRRAEATLRASASAGAVSRVSPRVPVAVLVAIVLVVGLGLLYALHVIREQREAGGTGRVRPAERIAPPPSGR